VRRLGFRWREGELVEAVVFWGGVAVFWLASLAAVCIAALRMF
jgi:hypothetical protein